MATMTSFILFLFLLNKIERKQYLTLRYYCYKWHEILPLTFFCALHRTSSSSSSLIWASFLASFLMDSSVISSRSLACSSSCTCPANSSNSSSWSWSLRSQSIFCLRRTVTSSSVLPPHVISSNSRCSDNSRSSFNSNSRRVS